MTQINKYKGKLSVKLEFNLTLTLTLIDPSIIIVNGKPAIEVLHGKGLNKLLGYV